jgi:hypothetical protein
MNMSDYERYYSTPFYRTILFLIGFLASFLTLAISGNSLTLLSVVASFYLLLAAVVVGWAVVLYVIRARSQNKSGKAPRGRQGEADEWPWGDANRARSTQWFAFGIAALGFGVGMATHVYKEWIKFVGRRFILDIDTTPERLLTFLFLIGVVMGAYVVRNWSKKQDEFNTSVTTALGAAFITSILGTAAGDGVNIMVNITHYGLGFALSFIVSLIASSALSARYSSTQSRTARALLDLLYGSERAEAIDRYFEKNFESDPDSAKQLLVQTLTQYRDRVLGVYAKKVSENLRRRDESSPPAGFKVYQLLAIQDDKNDNIASPLASPLDTSPDAPNLAAADDNRQYKVKLRRISNGEDGDISKNISKAMFRMGVAIREGDNLNYIVTPGEYRRAFPFYGSVAGLALIMRKTIVMHRDLDTKFRSENYRDGISPRQVLHSRGLDVIDYLSYATVPVASSYSNKGELALGIINVDTLLFLMSESERADAFAEPGGDASTFYARLTPKELKQFAARLYDQDDEAIKYLEDMRAIVVPVIQLYLKTLQGA